MYPPNGGKGLWVRSCIATGQRWRSSPTLCAGDFCVDGFALGLLWQRLGKVIIAQVKLTFQVVPDAGQANASAYMVNVCGSGRLTAKLGEQPSALEHVLQAKV